MLSGQDFATLSAHGFFNFYGKYRDRLVAHAKSLYLSLKTKSQIPPSIADCELEFEFELHISPLFADIIADLCSAIAFPKPGDQYWDLFVAGPIARYVTDKEWLDIIV